jgi:tetratricopeptide (TPR) repeat protein
MKPIKVRCFMLVQFFTLLLFLSACALGESSRKQASYHYQMGLSYLGENNITGALVELTEAEKLNPDDPDLQFNLGRAYFLKNRHDIAEQKFLKVLALKPEFSEARYNLGLDYLLMKRWDEAAYQFKLVTEDIFYQNQEFASINLGIAYLGKEDYPKALSTLRAVASSFPRNPIAKVYLGQVYLRLDRTELAILEFKRAVELDGNYANAYYNLALAYVKTKENQEAIAAFREVVRIAPESEMGRHSREYLDLLK